MTEQRPAGYGEMLRRRREQLDLSLDDVATRTRIRKVYLQALEEENLEVLPGAAYAVGFLRIYARHLGLAVEPLLAALTGTADPNGERMSLLSGGEVRRPRPGKGLWRLLALLLLVIALAAYAYLRTATEPAPAAPAAIPVAQPPVPVPPPAVPVQPVVTTPTPDTVEPVAFPVLPAGGAIVKMVATGAGVAKVALDGQETRDYQLVPGQQLNWKVSTRLLVELSLPQLVRCWVGAEEVALAENTLILLGPIARSPAPQ